MNGREAATEVADAGDPGVALKAAREGIGIPRGDIARTLNLEEDVIAAIEEGRFKDLPGLTYVRGYVRAYARLVGLDPDDIIARFDAASRGWVEPRVSMPAPPKPTIGELTQRRLGVLFGGIVLVLLIVGAVVLATAWRSLEWPFAVPDMDANGEWTVPAQPDPVPQPVSEDEGLVDAEDRELPVAGVSPNADEETVPPTDDELTFFFADTSWVTVDDAAGERIHADLGDPGESLVVRGEAPFTLKLGNAPGVELAINGDPVALEPHTRANGVADLVVGH